MRVIDGTARGRWLADRAGGWATVGGVAGEGFEAYARILHPLSAWRVDETITDRWGMHPHTDETTWPWSEVARRTGRIMHPLVQFNRLTDPESREPLDGGWCVGQPPEGWFDPGMFAQLVPHLETSTPDHVVVGIWVGWGLPEKSVPYTMTVRDDAERAKAGPATAQAATVDVDEDVDERRERHDRAALASVSPEFRRVVETGSPVMEFPGREYVLLEGALAELTDPAWGFDAGIGWYGGRSEPSPSLVWPDDHAWVVATEIDWDFTIVAGSRAVVDAVLHDRAFEAYEVRSGDALHYGSDIVNPDPTPPA